MMQIFVSMASALRTRSGRNGLSQNNIEDVANTIHHASSNNTNQRPNGRKHPREAQEEVDELPIKAKRAKLEVKSSPIRHKNQFRNRVVATTRSSTVIDEPSLRKTQRNHLLQPDLQQPTPNPTKINGVNRKRERSNISYSDKQVIAQSANESKGDGRRKLRSEEGAHYKSELSSYFNEYDEVIGNVVKENQLLNAETQITLVDESKSKAAAPLTPSRTRNLPSPSKSKFVASPTKSVDWHTSVPTDTTPRDYPDSLFSDLHDTKHFDLGFHLHKIPPVTDPLSDSLYDPAHRRLTRAEKSVRNQDKDRAQHEKDRVIQLLHRLKGHDWLKILGVTGITESKKKDFEPARSYFIAGCESILERFRLWKEEEKKKKIEKERVNTEPLEEDEEGDDGISDGDPPDYSDVDASAARQLHDEAVARMTPAIPRPPLDIPEPPVTQFKSFFDKPRVREASLRKHKRSTRSEIQAFGQPIPEVKEHDFVLDEKIISEGEAVKRERGGRTPRKTRRSGDNI